MALACMSSTCELPSTRGVCRQKDGCRSATNQTPESSVPHLSGSKTIKKIVPGNDSIQSKGATRITAFESLWSNFSIDLGR
jgi:hypothetical protein